MFLITDNKKGCVKKMTHPFFYRQFTSVSCRLYCLLYVPDEGADTYFGIASIELSDGLEKGEHFLIVNYGDDSWIHFRPCVGATARLTTISAATLYLLKESKTSDS